MSTTDPTAALTAVIKALTPLSSDERRRTVSSAMMFLGEGDTMGTSGPASNTSKASASLAAETENGGYSDRIRNWMQQHAVSEDELDRVFHFKSDGSFEIHDVPGKSNKDKTINTYILTGVGKYLTTGDRDFDDASARALCETIGCYDGSNHAKALKLRGAEFSGDKAKGYSLTNVGLKTGASLVKEHGGTAK